MYLTHECKMFWKLPEGKEPDGVALEYDKRFLMEHTPCPNTSPPFALKPNLITLSSIFMLGEDVSVQTSKGFVCPNCGRCNSRELWTHWRCFNEGCAFEYRLKHTLIPAALLHNPYRPLSTQFAPCRDIWDTRLVSSTVQFRYNYRVDIMKLPGVEGFVEHWIANKTVVEENGGPNDMFEELQTVDIGLRRR
jgi:hypothetical protein